MATEERLLNTQNGETQERLLMSLDKLEQKYELALQEWERLVTMEKDDVWPRKRGKDPAKRLPKLDVLSDSSHNELPEQAIREQLVQVLGKLRKEEVIARALERTVESQTIKLESERNQQHQLQQQLKTILHEKEELQKLSHKAKMHFQRVTPIVENVERKLTDNEEKLRKIDEDIMKIRRDAVELLQMHQVRYELEGQVETLSSSITDLQEQKQATMERLRDSQEEEVKLYHNMKVAVVKVCDQHIENVLELDGRYEVLWSNVDHSLDCCNKLLELTRPEVEALKVGTHLQTVKSSGDQLSAILSQANTRENNMKVTPIGDQPDVQVSDSLSAVHAMIQNEDVSSESQHSGTHGEPLLVYVDTGVRYAGNILCGPITAEGSVGGSHAADQQISKPVDAQPSLSFQDQIVSKPSKHFVQALSAVKPSLVLTHADKTETSGNSSPLFNDIFYPCNIVQQNDQTMPDKVPASQDCNTATISPSPTDISMPGKSLILSLSPAHTLSACHIESVTINEPTFPLLQKESLQKESSGHSDTVLVIEVVDEKEINVSEHQAEKSPNAMELMNNNITSACSPVVGYLPHNAVITLAEGKASQA